MLYKCLDLLLQSSKGTSDGSAQAEIESLTKQVAELKAELRRRSDAFNKLDVEIRKRNEDSGPLQDKIQDLEATVSVSLTARILILAHCLLNSLLFYIL